MAKDGTRSICCARNKNSNMSSFPNMAMCLRKILKRRSFSILLLLLLDFISKADSQNCGVPPLVKVKQDEAIPETLDTGQIFKTMKAVNVEGVVSVRQNPPDFTKVKLDTAASLLIFEVDQPLWKNEIPEGDTSPAKSYIDKERADCVFIYVTLKCTDGREKDMEIEIPVIDENTEPAHFDREEIEFEVEPCLSDRCPVIVQRDITVIDEDRDEENALMEMRTNSENVIVHHPDLSQPVEDFSMYDEKECKYKLAGFTVKIKLEIVWSEVLNNATHLSFDLIASNKKLHKDGQAHEAKLHVRIVFKESEQQILPPIFSSPVYFMYMEYPGNQFKVHPHPINASVPWANTGEVEKDVIKYSLYGGRSAVLKINETSADLQVCDTFNYEEFKKLRSSVLEYEIIAKRSKQLVAKPKYGENLPVINSTSTATLIVLFPDCKDYLDMNSSYPEYPDCYHDDIISPCPANPQPPISTEEPPLNTSLSTSEPPSFNNTIPTTTETPSWNSTMENTTEQEPIFTTTLPPRPTRPPGHCTCDCTQFSCRNSFENPIIGYSMHVDPYYCMKYHQCTKREDKDYDECDGGIDQSTFVCPSETIFCPNMSKCMTVNECLVQSRSFLNATSPPKTKHDFEFLSENYDWFCGNVSCSCFNGVWPGEPGNHCHLGNYQDIVEDPDYCDVFHTCQSISDPPNNYFIDYPTRCPKGLVYCPAYKECGHPTDPNCACRKTFKFCDVYEMGKWTDFDIFEKRFK